MSITILPLVLEPRLQENCYIVGRDGRCVIIDPGAFGAQVLQRARDAGLTPEAVLITHGHFDHVGGVPPLRAAGLPVYMHDADRYLTKFVPDAAVTDGQVLSLAGLTITVIHTPGHSPGGVCYLIENHLFSGDTLFHTDIGRTDFTYGDEALLKAGIREKLYRLPDDTVVYPGHEEQTTIGEEKRNNLCCKA
ncbi:MAG: MBL fold metallo-hydrolase [Clostridiales bacterium]|jgi:glyoxylase-like metal-dependent hydrolase (beta-lactamase superfamily II)|nr:MBL fold metallo-hydrolase [Clostridiales bacterium]